MVGKWPCQHLYGGWAPYIYQCDENGMCNHPECNPEEQDGYDIKCVEDRKNPGNNKYILNQYAKREINMDYIQISGDKKPCPECGSFYLKRGRCNKCHKKVLEGKQRASTQREYGSNEKGLVL